MWQTKGGNPKGLGGVPPLSIPFGDVSNVSDTTKTFSIADEGTYEVHVVAKDSAGETATKKFTLTVKAPAALAISTAISATSVKAGTVVTLMANASGGTAPYTFLYQYKRSASDTWTSFGSGAQASFKPSAPGTFNIRAYVKDNTGKAVCKSLTVNVTAAGELTNNSTVTENVTLGNPIVVTGAATGGTAPYTFTYQYKRTSATDWTTFGSGATAKFTPSASGTFNIRAYVKDSTGKTVVKSLNAKVV